MSTFTEALADEVLRLRRDKQNLSRRVRHLERSRDLWRHRALRKAGLRAS